MRTIGFTHYVNEQGEKIRQALSWGDDGQIDNVFEMNTLPRGNKTFGQMTLIKIHAGYVPASFSIVSDHTLFNER